MYYPRHFSVGLALTVLLMLGASATAQVLRSPIQYFRPYDKRGVNVFETPKTDTVEYKGFAVRVGASFTQSYQGLRHENDATVTVGSPTRNKLLDIYGGFNLANANLNLDAQLADGIRVNVVGYMSSKHHNEFWVKGGYIQFDKLPLKGAFFDDLMKNLTIKLGHYDVNYGDAHYRRSDGAQALYNPFGENYLMDAFATEIGAEFIYQRSGFLAVAQVTEGTIRGGVNGGLPSQRQPSFIGKVGYDKQLNEATRVRVTASVYTTGSSPSNTLYSGDRTGSHYFYVMDPALNFSASGNFTSGRINPGFSKYLTAWQINPFVKFHGLEFFGVYEMANGAANPSATTLETNARTWSQFAGDLIYRFGASEKVFVGVRYNRVQGTLPATRFNTSATAVPNFVDATPRVDVSVDRVAFGAGWFLTPAILLKGEYVSQQYTDYPVNNVLRAGKFSGLLVEAVIAF
jgi:hypothetical protein